MAGGVNKVMLVGHLGADPDMRYTPSGQGVCELRVATSESWNDKNGQRQERAAGRNRGSVVHGPSIRDLPFRAANGR